MYFTGDDYYKNFLVFSLVLTSLTLDKVTYLVSTVISSEKIKLFDTSLEPTMSDLANRKVKLKFNNSVLVQKSSPSL